jgi:hypothetical protein
MNQTRTRISTAVGCLFAMTLSSCVVGEEGQGSDGSSISGHATPPRSSGWWTDSAGRAYYFNGAEYCRLGSGPVGQIQGVAEPSTPVDQMSACGGSGGPPNVGWWTDSKGQGYYFNGSAYCREAFLGQGRPIQGVSEPSTPVAAMGPCGTTWHLFRDCRPGVCAPTSCVTPPISDPNATSTGISCGTPNAVCNTPSGARAFVCS